jgi:hypothetical protein
MGRYAEEARRYGEMSDDLGKIAVHQTDAQLKNLLLNMSSGYDALAGYFLASDERAGLICAGVRFTETDEEIQANREVRAILLRLHGQWEELATGLHKAGATELTSSE